MQIGNHNTQYNQFSLPPPRYCLEPIESIESIAAPVDPLWLSGAPSRLLDARAEVVPFTGREADLRDLTTWRDGPAGFLSVRLVHGPGGQGKTRLANHFAAHSSKAGWKVLSARLRPDPQDTAAPGSDGQATVPGPAPANGRDRAEGAGALLIVDYADRWPHSQLVQLFRDLRDTACTRVLLIGRSVQWWPAIRGELAAIHAEADERRLTSLGTTAADRQRLFEVARDRFAKLLDPAPRRSTTEPAEPTAQTSETDSGSRPTRATVPTALIDPAGSAYETVLTVHMAALVAAYAGPEGPSLPDRPEALAAYLLDREHMTWRRLFDSGPPFRTSPRELARVVFVATLTGAQPQRAGLAALRGTGLESVQKLLDDHRLCYPPFDAGSVLEPLYPDRLAEDFLALSLPGHDVEGYDPDPWAPDALTDLLARDPEGRAPAHTPQSVTFLAAAALRWPHTAAVVNTLLRADPGLAVDAGGAGLSAVAELPALAPDVVEAVVERFPAGADVDLDVAMASAIDCRTRNRLDAAVDEPSRLAQLIHPDIPYRLINAGRFSDALDTLNKSIPWWRRLARSGDAAAARALANALYMLCAALLSCGRRAEAIDAGRESVEICRRSHSDESDLGVALTNYSNALLSSGRLAAALEAATEAASLYRPGVPRSDEANATLATALHNQCLGLADAGQTAAASEAIETALDLRKQLSANRPATWEPGLAQALNTAGGLWAKTGEKQRALEASEASVDIYRRLTKANPAAYRRWLAAALTNLVRDLTAVGRDTDALDTAHEAVTLHRAMAAQTPLAHEPALATALLNLGSRLAHLHRWDEAIDTDREAVAILERLRATEPGSHESELARGLTNLSDHLTRGGRPAEALAPVRQAITIRQGLAPSQNPAHQADLAHSLSQLAAVCADTGQAHEGIKAANEAVETYLALTRNNEPGTQHSPLPDGIAILHRSALADAYMTLSFCWKAASRFAQALDACEQSVRVLLDLARTDPPRFEPDLAAAFGNLAGALHTEERHAEAAGTAQNAVLIFRRLAAANPARYNRKLAMAHHNLAVALSEPANPHHMAGAGAEAVKDLRRLTDADPEFAPDLVMALAKLSVALAGAARWPEVLATADEAVALGRKLTTADPVTHEPQVARLLHGTACLLFFADVRTAWAAELARESLVVYGRLAERDFVTFDAEHRKAAAELGELLKCHRESPSD